MKRRTILTGCTMLLGILLCLGLAACGGEKMQYDGLKLDDYITVGEYKGLEVDGYKIKVSEAEIQEKVEAALKENQQNKKLGKDKKLKKGDTANIDYTGKVDGKEFDGGASQGFDLELGSGQFIEGFEDGLIGHKVGEEVEVKVHFPDDYKGEKVAGKDAVFTVKINSATRPKVPEYNDEFVKKYTKFKTKEEYEESIREDIYKEKEEQAKTEQKNSLWSDVLESAEDALETAADAAGASGEIAKGDTGDGPAVLASKYADFTIPEGVTYEVYDYVVTDSTGSVIIDFGTTNTRQARIEISTTRMVSDLESAAGECERMHAGEYTSNTAERGATVTFGGQEYQIIYVTGDYADEIYLVTYLVNEEGRDTYVEVKLDQDPFGAEGMSTDDPALAEVLNAVAFH